MYKTIIRKWSYLPIPAKERKKDTERKGIIYNPMPIHLISEEMKTHSQPGKFNKAHLYSRQPEQSYIWFLPYLLFLINSNCLKIKFNIPFFCLNSSDAFLFRKEPKPIPFCNKQWPSQAEAPLLLSTFPSTASARPAASGLPFYSLRSKPACYLNPTHPSTNPLPSCFSVS